MLNWDIVAYQLQSNSGRCYIWELVWDPYYDSSQPRISPTAQLRERNGNGWWSGGDERRSWGIKILRCLLSKLLHKVYDLMGIKNVNTSWDSIQSVRPPQQKPVQGLGMRLLVYYKLVSGHVPLTTNTLYTQIHFCMCTSGHTYEVSMNNKMMQECINEY